MSERRSTGAGWIGRLRGRHAEPAPSPAPAPVIPSLDPSAIGERDAKLSGWLNAATGELAPGFPISAQDVVVDVGAGDGGLAQFCAQMGGETILVDQDSARLEAALGRIRALGLKVSGSLSDAAGLPLPDAAATRVICTEVLEHVDDPAVVMAELLRIGKPGALYLLSVPGAVSEQMQAKVAPPSYFEKPHHVRIFSADEFTRLVEDAGLVIEQRSSHGFFWSMWMLLFWQTGVELGASHPLLEAWHQTWSGLLASPGALQVKAALDGVAPKVNAVVARKPA